jgi:hypothetical protein
MFIDTYMCTRYTHTGKDGEGALPRVDYESPRVLTYNGGRTDKFMWAQDKRECVSTPSKPHMYDEALLYDGWQRNTLHALTRIFLYIQVISIPVDSSLRAKEVVVKIHEKNLTVCSLCA